MVDRRTNKAITDAVQAVYDSIGADENTQHTACKACGECCDFDAYDHRLFVTTPELIHFASHLAPQQAKLMPAGRCPYNIGGKCTVYPNRFSACRIFNCRADQDRQAALSQSAIDRFKSICTEFDIPYRYLDLPAGLASIAKDR